LDILIEELEGSQWVAAVEQGRLQGVEVDPVGEEVRWGSIYWAKVARIDAAQDAAFVNLDGENIGILYNADVKVKDKKRGYRNGGDIAIGKVLQPGEMIAVQAKAGFLPTDPEQPHSKAEYKSPRVSMNIVLPARYMIYTPFEFENRVSQRIRDKKLRAQLMAMLDVMNECEGCILRAAAAGAQTDILLREAKIQKEVWLQIQEFFQGESPSLIMMGPDAVQRTISDHAGKRINDIQLTTMDHFQAVEEWCEVYAPDLVTKIRPIELPDQTMDLGLFVLHDIISQIEDMLQPYAILPGGGSLIIQPTAALIAVDVNSGADKRGHLAVNLEAATELGRQLRLRNLGGAVIIDFLKMKDKKEHELVKKALEKALADDPCTVQIHGFTGLGMMELTRKRRTPTLQERFESVLEL